jgi:hypothetical protein
MAQSPYQNSKFAPSLEVNKINDPEVRRNFQNLTEFIARQSQLAGFQMIEFSFSQATENAVIRHSLGYVPKDVIITKSIGPGEITLNFGKFTSQEIVVSATDACEVRAFIGTYQNSGSAAQSASSSGLDDTQLTQVVGGNTVTTAVSSSSTSSDGTPTVQKFTSGSGIYTLPSSPRPAYIRVRMVGGGGGGSGSGSTTGTAGGTGGTTTFGTSLLTANGGAGYTNTANPAQGGGTATLGTGVIGTAIQGGTGRAGGFTRVAFDASGGSGAASPFGGAGGGGGGVQSISTTAAGVAAVANTGSGGGGAGVLNLINHYIGGGGSAGGYIDAIIVDPADNYNYTVGAAGTAGTAGTAGFAGGAGGSGYIEVTEFYS